MNPKLKALAEGMIGAVKQYVKDALASLTPRFDAMEARIAALEARPAMTYVGTWREGAEHNPGEVATHDGSLWYCWEATRDRPGTSNAWQLAVKHGRDLR
jgi:hypothetical protein